MVVSVLCRFLRRDRDAAPRPGRKSGNGLKSCKNDFRPKVACLENVAKTSDEYSVAVVNLMLDNLCRPASEGLEASLELWTLVLNFNSSILFPLARSIERWVIIARLTIAHT